MQIEIGENLLGAIFCIAMASCFWAFIWYRRANTYEAVLKQVTEALKHR